MNREILQSIIEDFSIDKFELFFRRKNNKLEFPNEPLDYNDNEEDFTEGRKLAQGWLDDANLVVCSFRVKKELSERSGKKAQYELGKKILKESQTDAGIFIFYDTRSNFRFSLIYTNYLGRRRDWSNFSRFTYFVSKELTNKTFLQRIGDGDFSTLDKIKDAFSVEKITKEFYQEIANWYFWAMDKIKFPYDYKYSNDPDKDKEIRNATNLIRLITRIIFIWFLKEKKLVPPDLFSKNKLVEVVRDFKKDKKSSNFYNAILQNLFFASLNQKMAERRFADERGYPANKKEYGVKTLYRYREKFLISKDEVLKLFKDIPFLNGGLFDCLDKEDKTGKVIYIDGFSRNPSKQAVVPDYLFFQEKEEKVDLSNYGLGKKLVRGLIEILNSYNFTMDENTPIDQEIALDPELLGKVFENLLASYNPETATTARKATGSYYTPREIVDYMVDASLFEYLKGKFPEIEEEKIKTLLSFSENVPEFSEEEKQRIISCIDEIKIIDPACGSGTFPMDLLHKLVLALQKLDSKNKYWYELQYQKALKESEEVLKQGDKNKREERFKEINETFDEGINYPDYARKMYLIENCIYGVDIQSIAIQITKLRFFISLVLDQKIDKKKENFGIRPLPNFETRFVTADTLRGLEIPQEDLLFRNTEVKLFQDELAKERHKYFNAKIRSEKLDYQRQDKILREKLAKKIEDFLTEQKQNERNQIKEIINEEELKLQKVIQGPDDIKIIKQETLFGEKEQIIIDKKKKRIKAIIRNIREYKNKLKIIQNQIEGDFVSRTAKKIANFDLFDQNASVNWFAPEWMFGVTDGFDIVIGNPPYIQLQKAVDEKLKYADLYKNCGYQTFNRTGDIYCLFYEIGMQLLKEGGILTYISSNKWMRAGYGESLRNFFTKYNPKILIDLGLGIFESATVDTNILLVQKSPRPKTFQLQALTLEKENNKEVNISGQLNQKGVILEKLSKEAWFIGSVAEQKLKEKIECIGKPLKEWDANIYYGIKTGLNEAFIITTEKRNEILGNCKDEDELKRTEAIIKPILRGRDIKRYYYEWAGLWVIMIPAGWTNKNSNGGNPEKFINKQFPSIMNHLRKYEAKAKQRDDQGDYYWELRHCAYYPEFEKDKVVYSEIVRQPQFYFDTENFYVEATSFLMTGKNIKYICGLLNSNPIAYFFKQWYAGGGLGEEGYRYKKAFIENLPLPTLTPINQLIFQQIEALVDKILATKKRYPQTNTKEYECQIDQMIYELYGLTQEEIKIIENFRQ